MYLLNANSNTPLHIQLFESIKKDIMQHYSIGAKLPSIRKVANEHNISKTTVESAYSQLYAEGYIESLPKRGYFVSDFNFDTAVKKAPELAHTLTQKKTYRYDFFPAQLNKNDFPIKLWKRLSTKAFNENLDFGSYHEGQGELALRTQIVTYLANSRGVHATAAQIIITSGFSDAMGLLAKLIKTKYTYFGIENPGYHIARRIFEEYGYRIEKIPVNTQGLDIDALKKSQAQIVYITPSHQYPTGVSMPISHRQKLLAYIDKINGLIIEDDYDSELRYESRPIPALQGLDMANRVVYLGTFSKSLSPALRIGYMVLPVHLLALFHASYDAHFPRVSLPLQYTMARFMAEGHYEKHVRKVRTLNKRKHNLMRDHLKAKLKNSMKIISQGGGLAILIYPSVAFDWEKFKRLSEEKSIKIYLAKERSGGDFEAIRMGFGGFSEKEIVEAVEVFCLVWHQSIK